MRESRTLLPDLSEKPERRQLRLLDVDPHLPFAANRFACDLFEVLYRRSDENTTLSPLSVWLALVAAWYGAEGETAAELGSVLRLGSLDKDQMEEGAEDFLRFVVKGEPDVELSIANSAWMRADVELDETYTRRITRSLRSALCTRDFGDPRVVGEVNGWVRDNTRGRIGGILDSIDADARLLLLNAVAFKAPWSDEFDPARTRVEEFQTPRGAVRVPLMKRGDELPYYEDERLQAVRLPYGSGGGLAMLVYLPRRGVDLDEICLHLDAERWRALAHGFQLRRGTLWLPRFGAEADHDLRAPLAELGLRRATDPTRADFGAIASTPAPLFLGDVRHKVAVDVDEQGTEAAAATYLNMQMACAGKPPPPPPPFEMRVDRPFLFVIADGGFSTILFMGAVRNPTA